MSKKGFVLFFLTVTIATVMLLVVALSLPPMMAAQDEVAPTATPILEGAPLPPTHMPTLAPTPSPGATKPAQE